MFAAALPVVGGGDRSKLIIKEKELLFVEQPSQNFGESTGCSGNGTTFEDLMAILAVIQSIMDGKSE